MGTIHNSVRSDGKEISDYQSFSLIVQTALLCVVTMQVWLGDWGGAGGGEELGGEPVWKKGKGGGRESGKGSSSTMDWRREVADISQVVEYCT